MICNFTKKRERYDIPEEFASAKVLIGNYERESAEGSILLKPYEALVLKKIN